MMWNFAELSDNSFEWKNVTFYRVKTYSDLPTYSRWSRPQPLFMGAKHYSVNLCSLRLNSSDEGRRRKNAHNHFSECWTPEFVEQCSALQSEHYWIFLHYPGTLTMNTLCANIFTVSCPPPFIQSINQSIQKYSDIVATDTARTTKKSYWEGKTKQAQFKMLFNYSQRWGRGDVQW